MLYSEQDEQIFNSDDAPEVEEPESVETPEPVPAEVEDSIPADESAAEVESGEPESMEFPEPVAAELEDSSPMDAVEDESQSEDTPEEAGQESMEMSEPEPEIDSSIPAEESTAEPDAGDEPEEAAVETVEDFKPVSAEAETTLPLDASTDEPQEDVSIEAEAPEPVAAEHELGDEADQPTGSEALTAESVEELDLAQGVQEADKEITAAEQVVEDQVAADEQIEPVIAPVDTEDIDLDDLGDIPADQGEMDEDGRSWYVVHCYSGYENKVRHNLEQRIETMGMKDRIFDIVVPTEEEIEVKEGKRRTVERRVFPGYILVNMVMTEESWYVVRNTPGVTGFVGMGNQPTPLRPEEVSQIIKRMEAEAPRIKVTFKKDERVRIVDGPFNDFRGTVAEIDMERAKVRVMVNFFGRETPVELDFLQVEKT